MDLGCGLNSLAELMEQSSVGQTGAKEQLFVPKPSCLERKAGRWKDGGGEKEREYIIQEEKGMGRQGSKLPLSSISQPWLCDSP